MRGEVPHCMNMSKGYSVGAPAIRGETREIEGERRVGEKAYVTR